MPIQKDQSFLRPDRLERKSWKSGFRECESSYDLLDPTIRPARKRDQLIKWVYDGFVNDGVVVV
jgi:hypothetical protein